MASARTSYDCFVYNFKVFYFDEKYVSILWFLALTLSPGYIVVAFVNKYAHRSISRNIFVVSYGQSGNWKVFPLKTVFDNVQKA